MWARAPRSAWDGSAFGPIEPFGSGGRLHFTPLWIEVGPRPCEPGSGTLIRRCLTRTKC